MPWETEEASRPSTAVAVPVQPISQPPPGAGLGDDKVLLEAFENEGGFLESYIKDRSKATDAPHGFQAIVALALVGAAAGNRYWWYAWARRNYANQNYLILGPSATVRKTTTINQGLDILEEAIPEALLPTLFSRESFEDALQSNPAGILVFSEFSEFLRRAKKKDYLAGQIELLTDLYDNPAKRTIKYRSRSFTIENPAPSILAASTLDWLEDAVDVGDLRGGFLVRFLPAIAMNPGPPVPLSITSWPTTTFVQALKTIRGNEGQVDFSAVQQVIQGFGKHYMADLRARGPNPDLMGMYHRAEVQVMKLAALFMLSRTHGTPLTVRDEDVLRAAKVVTYCHRQMELIPFAFTSSARQLNRFMEMIDTSPGLTQRTAIRRLGVNTRELQRLVDTIQVMGYTLSTKDVQGGPQVQFWPP